MKPRPALPAIASLYTQQRSDESVLHLLSFWATVCKTVRPMLSDPCLSVLSVCLSVCIVGVLWSNGWMDQDATLYGDRPWPRPHCVRWGPSSPAPKGAQHPQFSAHI